MCVSCEIIPPPASSSIRAIIVATVTPVIVKPNGKKTNSHSRKRKSRDNGVGIDQEDKKWFQVTYSIILNNSKGGKKRIMVALDVKCWHSENRSVAMMEKVRDVIKTKASNLDLDYEAGAGKLYMNEELPWEYLWEYAESRISKEQRTKAKYSERI